MSVLSPLIGRSVLSVLVAVGGAAAGPPAALPRPTNGHSDSERVSPQSQIRVAAAACSRDSARVEIRARLAMSLDDLEEVLGRTPGLAPAELKARYRAVFRDEVLNAALNAETRTRTASEIESDPTDTVARAIANAEQAFTRRTGVTAVAVLEGLQLSVGDPACGGPAFVS